MATGADDAHSAGMPQLEFGTFPNQIFWLVVALVAIYFILRRVALPRIEAILTERQDAIGGDLERAADLKRQAEQAEEAYNTSLANARAEAQQIAANAKAEFQKDVDAEIAKADAEIAAQASESEARIGEIRASANEAVDTVAKDTAIEIIRAIAPDMADQDAATTAVDAQLK